MHTLVHFVSKVCVFPQAGETALHLASDRGHVEVAKLLVKAKANVNILDKV